LSSNPSTDPDVAVVGAGVAGLASALGLAQQGLRVALIGPRARIHQTTAGAPFDARIYAVAPATVELLERLAVWKRAERDVRRGFTLPPKLGLGTLVDGALHPGWTWDFVRAEPIRFANVVDRAVGDGSDAVSLAEYIAAQLDPSVSWADVDWIRSLWDGPLVIKGIQTVDDAQLAADAGAAAIALSNHGGRQLDSAPVPLDLVAPVADAVGDRVEIICDGGVRRGSDIVKAVALGARACMAGRAYLYGLGAAGERGVDHVLALFAEDMRRTMALAGVRANGAHGTARGDSAG
jgi:L-lactate dehydrogenase (cytochrome)